MLSAAVVASFASMSPMSTSAPASARRTAIALPSPRPPPVTTARRLRSEISSLSVFLDTSAMVVLLNLLIS
jgi:hypothetical protein